MRKSILSTELDTNMLAEATYYREEHVLEIEFRNGSVYEYLDVPVSVYRDLKDAMSPDSYYLSNIKGTLECKRSR